MGVLRQHIFNFLSTAHRFLAEFIILCAFTLLLIHSPSSRAASFLKLAIPSDSIQPVSDYTVPNENYPSRLLPILKQAPVGSYISVGTERGFIGAAYSHNITHLILLDGAQGAVNYNRINILLLKMATSREEYLQLRLSPSHDVWISAAKRAHLTEQEAALLVISVGTWRYGVAENSNFKNFHLRAKSNTSKFANANYLFDDAAFNKISLMAKEDRIAAGFINFNYPDDFSAIIKQLKAKKISLSVFDISNAWWGEYIKKKKLAENLNIVNEVAGESSLLITTNQGVPSSEFGLITDRTLTPFSYFAYTFSHIRSYETMRSFVRSLLWTNISFSQQGTVLNRQSPLRTCLQTLSTNK